MTHAVLKACLPWLAVLVLSFFVAWALVRFSRARLRLGRLRRLHVDQIGSAQSLSFVLTLPMFIFVVMFILQVSQLMIGTIVVHYAAFAGARSAAVWIAANCVPPEQSCCISTYSIDPDATDQSLPVLDPTASNYGPASGGVTYLIAPTTGVADKYQKIASAVALACMPISPSRDLGFQVPDGTAAALAASVDSAYRALSPGSMSNGAIEPRLLNKAAYAMNNTQVEIRFFHKNQEPPLTTYYEPADPDEFYYNEVGWQDQITVTVKYKLALLPGPGRLLARYVVGPNGATDDVAKHIEKDSNFYAYPLQASASIGNEGEKPVIGYEYDLSYH